MKKILLPILLFVMFIPFYVNAETCDTDKISISSITLRDKTENVIELDEATASGKSINLNLSMSNVGDNIEYKIVVKNDSNEDYEIDKTRLKLNSDYINYSFETDDNSYIVKANSSKNVIIRVEYKNEVPDEAFESGTYNDNKSMTFNLSTGDTMNVFDTFNNPNTGAQSYILIIVIILLISGCLYILLKKKKYVKYMILVIEIAIIIPISVYAICKCEIEVNSNIILEKASGKKAIDKINDLVIEHDPSNTDVIETEKVSESCENKLAFDGTTDNNLRYVGHNPCNYVSFNNELWRIIGVMNNVDNGTGKKETRIKLIRDEPFWGYSWDSSSSNINSGYGVNDWSQADLMYELNGDYLNTNLTENTYWYNEANNKKTLEYDYTKGLKKDAQKMIENAKWYLGGSAYADKNAGKMYLVERSNNVWGSTSGQICDDGACPRATTWVGKVALMYPSDYGFAVGDTRDIGGNRITASRSDCLAKDLSSFTGNYCYLNDWLWSYSEQSLITPSTRTNHTALYIWGSGGEDDDGNVVNYYDNLAIGMEASPVVYLKENVYITNGDGSIESPYELGLKK